jgi:hypothetical protein
MANIGDRGFFGLAEGIVRPCVVVKGPIDIEGIVFYDVNVDVSPDDSEFLQPIEQTGTQPIQTVGDYGLQNPIRTVARRARKDLTSPPSVGEFHIPVT